MLPHQHPNDLVRQFHKSFNHPIHETPNRESDNGVVMLRLNLILEEFLELCEAVGAKLNLDKDGTSFIERPDQAEFDIVKVADALGDMSYVIEGANLTFGIPSKEVMDEIHRSNMTKLGPDGKPIYHKSGKVAKPENYEPPNLSQFFNDDTFVNVNIITRTTVTVYNGPRGFEMVSSVECGFAGDDKWVSAGELHRVGEISSYNEAFLETDTFKSVQLIPDLITISRNTSGEYTFTERFGYHNPTVSTIHPTKGGILTKSEMIEFVVGLITTRIDDHEEINFLLKSTKEESNAS